MNLLKAKLSVLLLCILLVPPAIAFLCWEDVARLTANSTLTYEVEDARQTFQRESTWSDIDLTNAQAVRARLNNTELQLALSYWIQARSSFDRRLIELRSLELQKLLDAMTLEIKLENQHLKNEVTELLALVCIFLVGVAGVSSYYLRNRMFSRIANLTNEMARFRIADYQTKLPTAAFDDEIGDLWAAFYAMIDSLYMDLYQDSNDNLHGSGQSQTEKAVSGEVKGKVQKLMVERRTARANRRAQERLDDGTIERRRS